MRPAVSGAQGGKRGSANAAAAEAVEGEVNEALLQKASVSGNGASVTSTRLVLGPFQGKPACRRIKVGAGVCGAAVAARETQVGTWVGAISGCRGGGICVER